ncbi:MAG: N-acetylmuramoyl-L-alanine amidase [Oscillospiraceae bacterium]
MKVWIDAGHGGSASGAVNGSRMEKNDTLRLAKLVQAAFERWGADGDDPNLRRLSVPGGQNKPGKPLRV